MNLSSSNSATLQIRWPTMAYVQRGACHPVDPSLFIYTDCYTERWEYSYHYTPNVLTGETIFL